MDLFYSHRIDIDYMADVRNRESASCNDSFVRGNYGYHQLRACQVRVGDNYAVGVCRYDDADGRLAFDLRYFPCRCAEARDYVSRLPGRQPDRDHDDLRCNCAGGFNRSLEKNPALANHHKRARSIARRLK